MIDAHCHLSHLLARGISLATVESRAAQAGISRIVSCSCTEEDWDFHSDLSDMFVPQFGIHPWWAASARKENWENILRQKLIQCPHAGVGEIGLDKPRSKRGVPFGVQLDIFRTQLDIAIELGRPCTVHCVQAFGPLLTVMTEKRPAIPIILHSYSGSGDFISQIQRVVGNIFFSVSARSPPGEVVKLIPLDLMLIETDSPDQAADQALSRPGSTPDPVPGANDCSQLRIVAQRVADATGLTLHEVEVATSQNARRAFRFM
jgi:TatD DNase family protein